MRKSARFLTFIGILLLTFNCKKEEQINLPIVETLQPSDQIANSITLNGKVIDENNSEVTTRGFCWSVNPNPGLDDSVTNSNSDLNEFSAQLVALSYSKKYYYKAFATNANGTSYGKELSFTTPEREPIITINSFHYDFDSKLATINYRVISESNNLVTHGVCFALTPSPTMQDNCVNVGQNSGTFNCELSNLEIQKQYFVRIFVQNQGVISYSDEFVISTVTPGPSLSLKEGVSYTSSDTTVQSNSVVKVGVNSLKNPVSGEKLVRYKFTITANNLPTVFVDSTFSSDSFTWETDLTLTGVGTIRLLFEIWDKSGMKTDKAFNITMEDPGTTINKYLNIELGSWNESMIGNFFSSVDGTIYTINQAAVSPLIQAKIDFLFFKGFVNQNTIASPDDIDANSIIQFQLDLWINKNSTRFNQTTITAAQFDAIGDTYQFPNFNVGAQLTKMNDLVNGQVFLFKTKNNKLGLIKIVDLYSRGDRAIVSVIVQK